MFDNPVVHVLGQHFGFFCSPIFSFTIRYWHVHVRRASTVCFPQSEGHLDSCDFYHMVQRLQIFLLFSLPMAYYHIKAPYAMICHPVYNLWLKTPFYPFVEVHFSSSWCTKCLSLHFTFAGFTLIHRKILFIQRRNVSVQQRFWVMTFGWKTSLGSSLSLSFY